MALNPTITVYGAYGHTGRFVVSELRKRGRTPILAGRDAEKLKTLAAEHGGLETRVASVDDSAALESVLQETAAVINCAGPFIKTSAPVIETALRAGIHYLDVTAEVEVAAAAFAQYDAEARNAGITILPAMGFYGGLGDLLATAAMNDWTAAVEIRLAFALDSWKPTLGTRRTIQTSKQRRDGRRLVFVNHKPELRTNEAPLDEWIFPAPFGKQTVVGEFTTADSVTISSHLKTPEIQTFMTLAPLKDLSDPDLSPPLIDESGRSSQIFLVEAVARRGNETRRATVSGRDIYAVSAPLVVEAAERLVNGKVQPGGVFAAGAVFDAPDFLNSLCPEHLLFNVR